ncbi:MAG: hypothetical protein Q8S13_07310, partial [Dehalococcoidia bacterium]|nr:hypothetical protein [Dehalococcoidia bacterium]
LLCPPGHRGHRSRRFVAVGDAPADERLRRMSKASEVAVIQALTALPTQTQRANVLRAVMAALEWVRLADAMELTPGQRALAERVISRASAR